MLHHRQREHTERNPPRCHVAAAGLEEGHVAEDSADCRRGVQAGARLLPQHLDEADIRRLHAVHVRTETPCHM